MRSALPTALAAVLIPVLSSFSHGQTTQGLIAGTVTDLRTGGPVANCRIAVTFRTDQTVKSQITGATGRYAIAPLSPGAYDLRVDCALYQGQESHNVQLDVASQLLINIHVRLLSEVWEDNYRRLMVLPDTSLLSLYGPDVDISHTSVVQPLRGSPGALEATVSQTIGEQALTELPLSGRDAYTLLVLQPGVTADAGTSRSLGLSVNGQRASASKFLLDGIENDNPLVTGPLSPIAPEALGEYRISSNSFSAEYGRTSGYVANAITRGGTRSFHATAYFFGLNDKLMARGPRVEGGEPSAPFRELQPGVVLTGPIRKRWNLLGSVSWEMTRDYTHQPTEEFTVPTKSWIATLNPSSLAYRWMSPFAATASDAPGSTYTYSIAPPLHINRQTVVPRADWTSKGGSQHLSGRYAGFLVDRPDYNYNPYAGFSVDLSDTTHSAAVAWTSTPHSRFANELRFGWSLDSFSALRPHGDVPILAIDSTASLPQGVDLPSSQVSGSFTNKTRSAELDENVSFYGHRHIIRAGGGLISRGVSGIFSSYDAPRYDFDNLTKFAADAPNAITVAVLPVNSLTAPLPDFYRQYSIFDWYGFIQDSFHPSQRLTLSAGLRYDWFGSPSSRGNTGDILLTLPITGDVPSRLAAATMTPSGSGQLYQIRHNGLAVRTGLSYALDRRASTVLRAGFGIYTDRPFDNLWQTIRANDYSVLLSPLNGTTRNYTDVPSVLQSLPPRQVQFDANDLTSFAQDFSTPRVMSWMSGVQHSLSDSLLIEGDYLGSYSGSLVATDRLNRQYSVPSGPGNPGGRYVPTLPDVVYRANQGRSQYSALTALMRYRSTRFSSVLSYTFSHSEDTQSDPLAGEFFDLGFGGNGLSNKATLIQQGDPSTDWGHADFDRRHNFVVTATWMLPGFLEGFRLSLLGAMSSGSPFTVFGIPAELSSLLDNPADFVPGVPIWADRSPVSNGVQLLNPAAFVAVADHVGNSGRNQLYGPGLVTADASLSRDFRIGRLSERALFSLRMDVYNVFNHGNLNNPNTNLSEPDFGVATRGPQSAPNAFRIFAPLADSRRQAQLMFKVSF